MKIFVAIACVLSTSSTFAGNCHSQAVAQVNVASASVALVPQGFLAVPYAVPVAVPSYVQYQAMPQYQVMPQYQTAPQYQAAPSVAEVPQPSPESFQARPPEPIAAQPVVSFLTKACAKCHSEASTNDKAKAHLRVDEAITDSQRVVIIRRLLTDDKKKRMPPGRDLDPVTLGRLIQEVTNPAVEAIKAPAPAPSQDLSPQPAP